jgi:hypothetical protein
MKHISLLSAMVILAITATAALAQTGGGTSTMLSAGYELMWSTIDGGGYMFSTGGGYSLGGTMGQPDAGALSGGGYTLIGGFWGGTAVEYKVYLPIVIK